MQRSYIATAERGLRNIGLINIGKLARASGISVLELIDIDRLSLTRLGCSSGRLSPVFGAVSKGSPKLPRTESERFRCSPQNFPIFSWQLVQPRSGPQKIAGRPTAARSRRQLQAPRYAQEWIAPDNGGTFAALLFAAGSLSAAHATRHHRPARSYMRVYLCEKPSQARDIAQVVGARQRRDGYFDGDALAVTWCVGHLIESAPPEAYGEQYVRWTLDQLPIVPSRWRVEIRKATAAQYRIVERLLRRATELVIATDADREGEMIAREIVDLCGYRGPIQRLWLSALNAASIRQALGALRSSADTLPLYHAALARSRADWLVGMNFSRLFTLLGRQAGHDGVLSVGRVQTPTLRLVVERDRDIARFVATPYWTIDVPLSTGGQTFLARWRPAPNSADDAGRCVQECIALQAAERIRAAGRANVLAVDTERVREAPPLPFNLSTLQETCSRHLGLGVQETLCIAQALYETHKATTYPRSDSCHLPESMLAEAPAVLNSLLASDPTLRPLIDRLDRRQRSRAWDDRKVTAHHAIIPTLEPVDLSAMSTQELAVYQWVRAYYLAQFLPSHEFDRTIAQFACGTEQLRAVGKQVIVCGWHVVLDASAPTASDDEQIERDQTLPALAVGASCAVGPVAVQLLKTQPPKPYTQGELVRDMKHIAKRVTDPRLKQTLKDTSGIGTEATRGAIIEGLLHRGYLVKKGRSIRAAASAITLIDAVPAALSDPGTTAVWEQALDLIASGQLTHQTFIDHQAAWVSHLVALYRGTTLALDPSPSPSCPRCNASMRTRSGPRGAFWSCARYPDCNGTQPIDSTSRKRRPASARRGSNAA